MSITKYLFVNQRTGINDYEEIFHKPFNVKAYKEIKQLIYVSRGDTNNTLLEGFTDPAADSDLKHSGMYVASDVLHVINHFGRTPAEVLKNQVKYINSLGYDNIEFYSYSSHGHLSLWNLQMSDIPIDFLDENR